jgi:hypothetical protein
MELKEIKCGKAFKKNVSFTADFAFLTLVFQLKAKKVKKKLKYQNTSQ